MSEQVLDSIPDDVEKGFSVMPRQKFAQSGDLKKII